MTDTQLPASVTANLSLLPGGDRLLPLHDAELPQKDDLCGAFWGTLALRVAGITTAPDGGVLDQDTVGALAGSVIARGSHADDLPPGEPGRSDYRLEHPRVDDPKLSGTSIAGVIRAIGALSEGGLEAVPISGPFETEDLRALFAIIRAIDRPGVVVMNVGTQYLWGAAADEVRLNAYLETGDWQSGTIPDWNVGHFVGVAGTIDGPAGTLVLICDTYRSLGANALHLQPIENVALALRRPNMTDGGVVLLVPPTAAAQMRTALITAGFVIGLWDNGSPEPSDAA